MIWGMDLWVFTAFILTYIAIIFSLIYGLWPRKEEKKEEPLETREEQESDEED